MPGTLTIRPLSAKLTRDTEFFGQMDPYCKITFGKQKVQGSVCKNGGKYPHWDDALILRRANEPELEIEIKEKDWLLPDGTIGTCRLNLREVESQRRVLKWFPVSYEHKPAGQILIEATFEADHSIPRNLPAQQTVVHPQDIPHVMPYQEPEYSADRIRGERSGHHESSQPAGYGGDIPGWNPFNPTSYQQEQPQPTYNQGLSNEYYQPQGNQGQYFGQSQPSSNDDNTQKYPMFSSQENQRFYENQQPAGNYQGNQGNQVIDYRDNANTNANAPQQNYNYEAPQHLYTNEPLNEQHHQTNQRENQDQDQLDPIHQMIRGAYYKGHH